ncbi:MAG: hypothetical protein AAFQ24_13935 [Pseudomonadota bacterium]
MSKVEDFFNRNQIGNEGLELPYVHSTQSYNIEKILRDSSLKPSHCPEFEEELLYFFRGRPAYKQSSEGEEASHWQLPTCFLYDSLPDIAGARTYPFDSGAFKQGRYPSYIRLMPLEEFELVGNFSSDRIVEAFFGDIESYLNGDAKTEQEFSENYTVSAFDAEVMALRRLASDGTPKSFDDRRFTIEVQTKNRIDFEENPPSAVILPTIYLGNEKVRSALDRWDAAPITYDVHAQSLDLYYGVIFQKYLDYLRESEVLR